MSASIHPAVDAVSVIMIVRNGESTIAEALASVYRSEIKPLETLVIDGHSSDRTAEIATAHPLVRVVPEIKRGIPNAYNQGIAIARAPIVAFLSHDDMWVDGKLDRQLSFMRARPELLFTVGMVEHFLDGDTPPPGFRCELLDGPRPGYIMETFMARKKVFEIVGLFDPKFPIGEDTDWFARARDLRVPSEMLPETLARKRVHSTNASLNDLKNSALLLNALRDSVARKRSAQKA